MAALLSARAVRVVLGGLGDVVDQQTREGPSSDEFDEFAWNAGFGVDYALTDFVDLSAGYRFVCLAGEQCMAHDDGFELTTTGGAVGVDDRLEYDVLAHEFRVQIRIEVFDLTSPWR